MAGKGAAAHVSADIDVTTHDVQDDVSVPDTLDRWAKLFRGPGDPGRPAILDARVATERSVREIVSHAGLGQPNVSNHLRCLLYCAPVGRRSEGRFALCRLADSRIADLIRYSDRLLDPMAAGLRPFQEGAPDPRRVTSEGRIDDRQSQKHDPRIEARGRGREPPGPAAR